MTKKVNLLIGEPCPELLCGICSDVLEDPMQVHCPEDHMFCKKCIEHHITQQSTCPMCMTTLDSKSFQLSKFAQRQISHLRIKCLYADNGCTWTGLFSDCHSVECKFKPVVCPNADKGCTEKLTEFNKDEHSQHCLYRLMTCPNQNPLCQPFLLKDLTKHENECQSYACPYASEGCSFIGTRPQTSMHCEQYCGRLHQRIDALEAENKRLNKLIHDFTMGFNLNLPQTPDTMSKEKSSHTAVNTEQQQNGEDTAMDEMDLFHQMFNADPFGALTGTATPNLGSTVTNNSHQANDSTMADISTSMMDINACLPDMNFLHPSSAQPNTVLQLPTTSNSTNSLSSPTTATTTTTAGTSTTLTLPPMTAQPSTPTSAKNRDTILEDVASPPALEFVPPLTAPKRASNGKRIRYSKNLKLAHNALRIARQRTTNTASSSHSTDTANNPSNDAILNNLNIAKQQKKNQITFKHMNEALSKDAHNHNISMMNSSNSNNNNNNNSGNATKSASLSTFKKERKRSTASGSNTAAANTTATTLPSTPAPVTPQPATASSPGTANSNTSTTPKRKPMFILASSYLSNYNSSGSSSSKDTNTNGNDTTSTAASAPTTTPTNNHNNS